ncbi:hypothetical protein RvY_18812 [Ramazzottius varieornatus]|uniref:Uncharacterized protein n=1 Tax=Ramazzottius varieornatus TaxID=947166 RepID=A0A1D1WBT3_RAMVA|nr:hypothetical protein RvY_18812 [Ramazzottius varieornatus]
MSVQTESSDAAMRGANVGGQVAPGYGQTEYGRMVDRPGPGRPLVMPYTYASRVFQFPFKLNWQRNWLFRYYIIGFFAGLPFIYKIHKMANSPENVENWKAIRQKWRDEAMGKVHH